MPRANWHLDVLPVDESDPFAAPVAAVEVERVDLSDLNRLQAQLLDLVLREGQLQASGITCPIKERTDSCCSACPLYGRQPRIVDLCHLGREQESTTMAMLTHG